MKKFDIDYTEEQQQQDNQNQSNQNDEQQQMHHKSTIIDREAISKAFDSLTKAASIKTNQYSATLVKMLFKIDHETDLSALLSNQKKHWQQFHHNDDRNNQQQMMMIMIEDDQAMFNIQAPDTAGLPLITDNLILQSTSRLLLYSFDWIKNSNNAFKLLE